MQHTDVNVALAGTLAGRAGLPRILLEDLSAFGQTRSGAMDVVLGTDYLVALLFSFLFLLRWFTPITYLVRIAPAA